MKRKLVVLTGPTAVGKTDYSLSLAKLYDSPVINCDSRQIYKEMTIGTAVPSASLLAAVKHYFIQTHSVKELYTAGKYEIEALEVIESLFEQGHETLLMTGGSGFYIDAVCNGLEAFPPTDMALREEISRGIEQEGLLPYQQKLKELDPQSYATIDIGNKMKVLRALEVCISTGRSFSSFKLTEPKKRSFEIEKIVLSRPRDILYERIGKRVDQMMSDGLLEEVEGLRDMKDYTALQTVGYKELFSYMEGECTLDKAVEAIKQHTRNYAKRQITWFRRDPAYRWIELDD